MIRVYLDWNIFSYLRHFKNDKEPFKTLHRNLVRHSDKLLIPYSAAHLIDLKSSTKKQKGLIELENDLDYLQSLTKGHCIVYDFLKQSTYPEKIDVRKYYQLIEENEKLKFESFEDLFTDGISPEIDKLNKQILELYRIMPSNMRPDDIESLPKDYGQFKEWFSGESMLDVLNGVVKMMNIYQSDPKAYRSIRNASVDDLKLTFDYSNEDDPIKRINENLEQSKIRKSFTQFADEMAKSHFKDKEPKKFDFFTNYYIYLDFFGFYRDKVFNNLVQDSRHAYFGAHCDFFITEDDNTYQKAKVLYDYFNISTKVCKSNEFNSELYNKFVLQESSDDSLFDVIAEEINSSFVLSHLHDDQFNPADIYKTRRLILNYFNRIQITHNVNGSKDVYLYRKHQNYSDFYFFTEVEKVVNRIALEIGRDSNGRLEYDTDAENTEILKDEWAGRVWSNDRFDLHLKTRNDYFGLIFSMNIM